MKKKILITIICFNHNSTKHYQEEFEEENNIGVSRVIMGYKPKRGYEVVQIQLDYVEVIA
jgi:hypothetical protein